MLNTDICRDKRDKSECKKKINIHIIWRRDWNSNYVFLRDALVYIHIINV